MKLHFIVSFFLMVINYSFGQTAEEILSRYFKASSPNGDISKWDEIKTLYSTSVGYFNPKSVDAPLDTTFDPKIINYHKSYKRWPDEQKEELFGDSLLKYHNSSFYFLKNRTVIMLGFMDPIEVNRKNQEIDFYPMRIYKYMRKSKSISYGGIKVIQGKSVPCYEIEIKTSDASHVLFFNTESYLLDAIYFTEPNYYTMLSDYRLFEGYLLPTYEVSKRNGVTIAWKRHRTYEFNVKFDENQFDPQYEKKYWPMAIYPSTLLQANESTLVDFVNANFTGKRVFVDMWATWCSPCRYEFTKYDSTYYSLMEKEGINLVYLSIDEDKKKWEDGVKGLGLKGFHVRASKELIKSLKETIFEGESMIIPRYVLIDNDGTIISKDFVRPSNPIFKDELHKALKVR
jgi:thiol-disulfide isomerase/thioredoxin